MSNILSGDNSNVGKQIHKVLDSVGDGSGTTNMATTTDEYFYKPLAGEVFEMHKIIITWSDATTPTHALYGGITALSTGCLLKVLNDTEDKLDLLHTEVIKDNTDLARHSTWWNIFSAASVGLGSFVIDFGNRPVTIVNDGDNQRISYNVQDDLSGLLKHTVAVIGFAASVV